MSQTPPPAQPPAPNTISPDGQWRWDGAQWVPNTAAPTPAAVVAKKGHKGRNLGLGCAGLLLLLVIIGVAASSGSKNSSQPAVPDKSTAASSAPAPAATKVLLDLPGSGIKQSQKFTAAGDWDLEWSYDCTSFSGGTGNFQIYVYNSDNSPVDVAANALGAKGSDVSHQHAGGTYYLKMNSECTWRVVVKG